MQNKLVTDLADDAEAASELCSLALSSFIAGMISLQPILLAWAASRLTVSAGTCTQSCFALQAVREKVVANLAASLEKAASELKKEGHSEGLPDATEVARAVEQALQKQFSMHAVLLQCIANALRDL